MLRGNRVKRSIFGNKSKINNQEFDLARIGIKYFRKLFNQREFLIGPTVSLYLPVYSGQTYCLAKGSF